MGKRGRAPLTLTSNGETWTIGEWAKKLGIPFMRIHSRLASGWSVDEALGVAARSQRHFEPAVPLTYKGKTQAMSDWAREIGITLSGLSRRLSRGWPLARALSSPRREKIRSKVVKPCAYCKTPTTNVKYCERACFFGARARKLNRCGTCGMPTYNRRYCSSKCNNTTPRLIEFQNKTLSMRKWSKRLGVDQGRFCQLINTKGLVPAFEWAREQPIKGTKPQWVE